MKQWLGKLLTHCALFLSICTPQFFKAEIFDDTLQPPNADSMRACGSCTCVSVNQKLRVIDTKEDAIQSQVLIINSIVDTIATVISEVNASQFAAIESLLEIVSQLTINQLVSTVDLIASDVDVLNTSVHVLSSQIDFLDSKTDACCQATQSRLDLINSKADAVNETVESVLSIADGVESQVDTIDALANASSSIIMAIDSKTDACCQLTQSKLDTVNSKIDNANNDILATLSLINVVDSKVDNANNDILTTLSETEVIESKADACCNQTQSKLTVIDSKVDAADFNSAEALSFLAIIESKVDNADRDILTTLSEAEVIESKTDACCATQQSTLSVIDSKVDNADIDILSTLSLVEVVESKVDNANNDVLTTLSEAEVIDSKADACCQLTQSNLDAINSKVDDAENTILTTLSILDAVDSKVDNATIDILTTLSEVEVVESKTDACCDLTQSTLGVIDSKVDNATLDILTALSQITVIDSKVDNADKDILQTLSETEVIESKADACCDLTQSLLNAIDSKTDAVDVNILTNFSIEAVIESKTDSCCDVVNSKLDFANSLMEDIDSKVDFMSLCISTPFFGGTISTSGRYCLATNLTGSTNITIAANDVILNLNGYSLSGGSSISFDTSSAWSNITIQNGFISGATNGITLSTQTFQNVQFLNLALTQCTTGINISSGSDLVFQNVVILGGGTGLSITNGGTQVSNVRILNSNFNQNTTGATLDAYDLFIKDCAFNENNSVGLILSNALQVQIESSSCNNNNSTGAQITSSSSDIKIKDTTFNNQSGFNQQNGLQIGQASGLALERCFFNGNENDGVHMEISGTAPSDVEFVKCEAHNNGSNGFNIMGTNIVARTCFACSNTSDGFLVPSSPAPSTKVCLIDSIAKSNATGYALSGGVASLLKENIATGNTTFGFNDTTGSTTRVSYVANAGKTNGSTPAGSPNDTNYAVNNTGNSFNGTGPGAAPYYEFSRTATGKSYWDNITLP